MISERIEAERERLQQDKLRKRYAYEAICALTDTVNESELQRHLSVLDPTSWCEVVEERFLGRLCGFPLCAKTITVDFRKKHTIVRRLNESTRKEHKMIVPTESEPVKFCSDRCMGKSRAIAAQLTEQQKHFVIPNDESQWMKFLMEQRPAEGGESNDATSSVQRPKFGVELVTKLHDLKLADAEPNDEKDEAKEESPEDSESEEKQFLKQIKEFVTTKNKKDPSNNAKADQMSDCSKNAVKLELKEWKRGFLLVPPSSANEIGTDSIECLRKERKTTDNLTNCEVKERNGKVGKGNALLGEVIERKALENAKERLRGQRDTKKPKVVEAPRINPEQVRQTF
ncbi:hypothetical protein niasHS_014917 [Heterodera schachtii]|uniref:RNA polymerase II subunit B1 CTD phosphatase RPAP2 homolog n=1 Tax=Heterodera schachtii TaxID=97005 RepID=A0ABD2IL57_HETSC